MAENYLTNPIFINVNDKKYGESASAFIGRALKAYLAKPYYFIVALFCQHFKYICKGTSLAEKWGTSFFMEWLFYSCVPYQKNGQTNICLFHLYISLQEFLAIF